MVVVFFFFKKKLFGIVFVTKLNDFSLLVCIVGVDCVL